MLGVDHCKFGRNAMVNMGSISMVNAVYTDVMPPAGVMQVIKDNNVQLELCSAAILPLPVGEGRGEGIRPQRTYTPNPIIFNNCCACGTAS